MNVALSTQSQLEIRYLFKSFMELCEVSEAFSFTYLQQVVLSSFRSICKNE